MRRSLLNGRIEGFPSATYDVMSILRARKKAVGHHADTPLACPFQLGALGSAGASKTPKLSKKRAGVIQENARLIDIIDQPGSPVGVGLGRRGPRRFRVSSAALIFLAEGTFLDHHTVYVSPMQGAPKARLSDQWGTTAEPPATARSGRFS
jgi:hypothetical protein